ncbi:GntR family transcriptional regulator [Rhodococcus sp. NPDC060176]|uniref:GntR family transcriptional regulator n=1 Tax=Rhodococcus sp. NPDC060176 TaxID=3347062 RepID=UPI003669019E
MATQSAQPQIIQSKPQLAYHFVKERITRREYTPGYRLVLGSIANALDMSVVPVREAIRQLEAEGLVTFERNVGAHVSMIDDLAYRSSMQTLSILEGAATALAARQMSEDDIQRARDVNDRMIQSLSHFDPHEFTSLNQEFHSVLFSRCQNARLFNLVEAEWGRLGHLRASTFSFVPSRARESVAEHAEIVRLIESGASLADIEDAARRHRSATLDAYIDREHPNEPPCLSPIDIRNGDC